jgi:predicted nucleotidyltransferase
VSKKLNKKQAQKRVWKFIREFRDKVVPHIKDKLDFIIIYGSAVRGEFVPGKSDVDIVFQVFKQKDKKLVEEKATEIFWETAKKYPELQFEKSLSVSQHKKRNAITKILEKAERSSFLYVPVFVFVKGEIDWAKGELHSNSPLIKIGQQFLIPQRTVFLRFKQEGEILFGRDVREDIKIRLTIMDKLRLGVAPQLLSFVGFMFASTVPKKARGYAVKALLYQVDALITALGEYEKIERLKKIEKSQKMLLQEYTEHFQKLVFLRLDYTKGSIRPADFCLFTDAIKIKWGEKRLSYFGTIWFCFKAWFFILRSNLRAIALIFLRNCLNRRPAYRTGRLH